MSSVDRPSNSLVTRLRGWAQAPMYALIRRQLSEAADEIERLKADNSYLELTVELRTCERDFQEREAVEKGQDAVRYMAERDMWHAKYLQKWKEPADTERLRAALESIAAMGTSTTFEGWEYLARRGQQIAREALRPADETTAALGARLAGEALARTGPEASRPPELPPDTSSDHTGIPGFVQLETVTEDGRVLPPPSAACRTCGGLGYVRNIDRDADVPCSACNAQNGTGGK